MWIGFAIVLGVVVWAGVVVDLVAIAVDRRDGFSSGTRQALDRESARPVA